MSRKTISVNNFADLLGVSRATVELWIRNGKYPVHTLSDGKRVFFIDEIKDVPEISSMTTSSWCEEMEVTPAGVYTSVELFAGGGGLALGMEKAGFHHMLLNEFDHNACETLRHNRPSWNVVEGDVHDIDFTPYRGKIDFLSGGFPCQAFSYAGKRLGFEETRGTLFFELARAVKEIQPKVFMGENVRGLFEHDSGRTLQTIKDVIAELGYTLIEPRVLRALQYDVPQKRERLILIAIRNDIAPFVRFKWPDVCTSVRTLRDAFFAGELFGCDVPESDGQKYPESKFKVMELVPEGGDWRNLPEDVARAYMKGSYNLGGGKTGMARRLAMDEPSLTLTCAPAQKQTERCHPYETRPLTVREYARIQTFPDDWQFCGNLTARYKQIGNAVPVNLAWAIGRSLIRLFNDISAIGMTSGNDKPGTVRHYTRLHGLFEGMVCEKDAKYQSDGTAAETQG
ncbi:MAG: DNA (cytosine-5-)-methyltransferase [Muribaculaceae bacterium]|nr:DNA (cytosine-5-)-methyltransferase [Muribaculaceae bacterium]